MKRFIKYIFIVGLFSLASLLNPVRCYSQGGPQDPGCDPLDPACPIDSGVGLLIAAGIGISAVKAIKIQKATLKI